jgi:hypothetical protein
MRHEAGTARRLAALLAVAAFSGCTHDTDAAEADRASRALLRSVPQYPGAPACDVSDVRDGDVAFAARDCALADGTEPAAVVDFYTSHFQRRGWRIDGRNSTGLSAVHGSQSVDVGVRGDTLEVIARAR